MGWLDILLDQIEQATGLERGRIAIEAQIEDAAGLANVDAIAAASLRLEALVFGPADFMASLGMRSLTVGAPPPGTATGTRFTTRTCGFWSRRERTGCRPSTVHSPRSATSTASPASAASTAAIGFDGKWVLHPGQVDAVNGEFSPSQADYDRAELIIEAYEYYTSVLRRGAAMLDGEMIDEASRKLALVAAARGRAVGLTRTMRYEPPEHCRVRSRGHQRREPMV